MANSRTPHNLFEALFGREAYERLTAVPEKAEDIAKRAYSGLAYLFASPTPEEIERTAYGLTAPLRTAFQPPSEKVYQVAEIASRPFKALAEGLSPAMEKVAKTLASAFQKETETAIPTAKAEEVPTSAPTPIETSPAPSPAPAKTPADLIDWGALSRLFRDKRATPAGIKLVLSTILDAFRLLGAIQRRSPFETLIEAYEPLLTLQKSYLSALQQETNSKAKEQLLLKINEIERRLQPFYAFVNMISRAYGLPTAGIPVGGETPAPTGATAPTTASALPLVPPEKIEESPFAKHLSKYLGRE